MQPTASNQSSLRCPLNEVFGSKGQVRLLRVLAAEATGSLHPSEAAARAGMTESGARKILHRLTRTGLVERTGNGRKNRFVFCREGALAKELARLFEVERNRSEVLAQALRRTIRGLSKPPEAAWVQDFLAGWPDCQEVGVFDEAGLPAPLLEELREGLVRVEEEFEIVLEVRGFSMDEIASVDWSKAMVLRGTPPGVESGGVEAAAVRGRDSGDDPLSGNGKLNPESPEFSGALVALLEENLSVLRRARENVREKLDKREPGNGHDLWEWQKILDTYPFPRLLHFLESDSPRAVRLRECSPFPAVLSDEEKAQLEDLAERVH